ncbi:MAG: right-handed parallel beta-helix repeat-containing protein [Candidatus Hodarchaeota archaeon]
MNFSKRKTSLLVTFGVILLALSIFSTFTQIQDKSVNSAFQTPNTIENKQPKSAGSWSFESAIVINATGDGVSNYNWTTASAEEWCSGSGTEGDPYLLENMTISVNNTGAGLQILNSGVFFTLHNVTVTNVNATGDGLSLYNVENGTVNTCYFSNNGRDGIIMENVNITTLTGVTATGNGDDGLHMINSVVNTIGTCNFSVNGDDGGYLANCTYNGISGSYFSTNLDGLYLEDSDSNNMTIQANFNLRGLVLNDSDDCIITGGEFKNNTVVGVLISEDNGDSVNNTIYFNTFENDADNGAEPDAVNAVDNSTLPNAWDYGTIGNIWSDYSGVDENDDSIGDTPYSIGGTAGAVDNYPIFSDGPEPVIIPAPSVHSDSDDTTKETSATAIILFAVIFAGVLGGLLVLSRFIRISPKTKRK